MMSDYSAELETITKKYNLDTAPHQNRDSEQIRSEILQNFANPSGAKARPAPTTADVCQVARGVESNV